MMKPEDVSKAGSMLAKLNNLEYVSDGIARSGFANIRVGSRYAGVYCEVDVVVDPTRFAAFMEVEIKQCRADLIALGVELHGEKAKRR